MSSKAVGISGQAAGSIACVEGYPFSPVLDRLGVAASLACAIHCLAAPVLLLLLPAAGSIWSHPSVHWILAALVLPLALIVVFRGYRHHRRRAAPLAAVLGAVCIVAGLVIPNVVTDARQETVIEVAGLGLSQTGVGAGACVDTCCPTLSQDTTTGALKINLPPASIATMIGSAFLVLAHGINLYGCYCFTRTHGPHVDTCGCANLPA